MNIEAMGAANLSPPRVNQPAQQVERKRQDNQQDPQTATKEKQLPPEELLSQIKAITEDGLYSVRFERDSGSNTLIVKIVDSETDEVIRQIPSKELINLSKHLQELKGNVVNSLI